jgi:hypothetical protein
LSVEKQGFHDLEEYEIGQIPYLTN